ncbi:short-chain dehydrogenase [Coleophoma cylindrospora]|uniref:Short-chain dehydrogenase n=1 Tax=Coleophoma cylindrospora TaxID=1849047 RepID=A0A3D8S129_9HELO|nr:short-chain dehydrogenase [Coleophoma cylindrospora]
MASSKLAGKSVIVTGGGSGIGLAIVRFFAEQKSVVTIFDISQENGTSVLADLRTEHPQAQLSFKRCDISDWEAQKKAFDEVYQETGTIDIVIANAGISERGNFLSRDEGEAQKPTLTTLDVNVSGTLYSIKLGIHYMRKNSASEKGSIICTSSNAGIYPFPMAPLYATSKHAVVGAVRSLARPLALEGIQINGLAPAVLETNIAPDKKLFSAMILTPMSSITNAVRELVTRPELTGVMAEVHEDKFTFREPPAFVDENTGKNIEMFWQLGYA